MQETEIKQAPSYQNATTFLPEYIALHPGGVSMEGPSTIQLISGSVVLIARNQDSQT
jgi:hypothetical protein